MEPRQPVFSLALTAVIKEEKNDQSRVIGQLHAASRGVERNMKNTTIFRAVVLLGAGLALTLSGCKSAPELAQADAQKMIQAKLDADPAVPVNITVDDLGMQQGATGGLWTRSKVYPNRYWADFTLTPEGKKAIKLASGGDTIQWRPENATDKKFSIVVTSTTATHPKAKDAQAAQNQTIPGASAGKSVLFTEVVNLDGVQSALQKIAHNPANLLSDKKQANFVFENGAWKLKDIQ
jgi:preprotein translocase subunit SecG